MKDQVHYNSTPDQGWSKLRPILDEAMPVNRPARRFAFLWWSTSAVLMSGVLGLFVFRGVDFFTQPITTEVPALNSNQNHNSAPRQTKDELNAHKSKVNTPTTTPALTVPNQKSEPTNIKSDHKNHKSLKPVAPPKTGKKPLPSEPMAEVKTNQMNVVDNLSVATNSSATAAFPHELSTNVEGSASQETMQDRSTQCGIIPFQVVESIPILSNTSLEANETNSNLIIPGKANKVKKSTPFIEPTISASGLIGLNGGVGGSVTAGVDLNVSRRFSVTTGVGYLGYRPDASFFGGAQDFSSNADYNAILNYDPTYAHEGINTYVDGTSFNSAAGYNAINPLVENLHQWQVSGGVKWKMTPRFYMDAGVIIGFGTTAYSEYPIVSGDPLTTNASIKIGNTLNSYDVIRSTMTSLYGGIGYNVCKNFDVFAQWTHGLDSYILSDPGSQSADLDSGSRTDYIRGLNIGLKYTL